MKILISEKLSPHKYKTSEGYLICTDAILARTGKQRYKRGEVFGQDCKDSEEEVWVDRKHDEVFSPNTLASFENKPITVEHPDEDVNVDNYSDYAVGFVRDVHQGKFENNDVILGTLVITDKKTIEEIEDGQHTELSCGYDCDISDEDDPQQRNIRGNHVALCQSGRAGIARIVDSVAKDINPRKNESQEEFISRFMSEMENEYPDQKQRLAVAYSTWRSNDSIKDDTKSNAIRMAQDWVDEDVKKYGRILESTKSHVSSLGLTIQKNYNEYIVEDCDMKKDSPDMETKSGRQSYYLQQIMAALSVIDKRKWNHSGTKVNVDNNKISLIALDNGIKIVDETGNTKIVYSQKEVEEYLMKNVKDSINDEQIFGTRVYKQKKADDGTIFTILETNSKNWYIVTSNFDGKIPYTGAGSYEVNLNNAEKTLENWVLSSNLQAKYGKSEGHKRYLKGYNDSVKDGKYVSELKPGDVITKKDGSKWDVVLVRRTPFGIQVRVNSKASPVKTEEITYNPTDMLAYDSVKDSIKDSTFELAYRIDTTVKHITLEAIDEKEAISKLRKMDDVDEVVWVKKIKDSFGDSIKDAADSYHIRWIDTYSKQKGYSRDFYLHDDEINANSLGEALEKLANRVALSGVGTYNTSISSIHKYGSSGTTSYMYSGRLSDLLNKIKDSNKDAIRDSLKVISVINKIKNKEN